MEEIKAQYETNLFGVIRVTQAVLPIMRKQKSGIIVNMSSGLGRLGFPIQSVYVSTKFAIEGLTESMAYELEPFGIKMVLVEPGFIKTNIGNNMVTAKKSQDANSPYFQLVVDGYAPLLGFLCYMVSPAFYHIVNKPMNISPSRLLVISYYSMMYPNMLF
jgi:NAD(P)-dependent dehydrogenase (short-subunit alcohol dehydrogenase family)